MAPSVSKGSPSPSLCGVVSCPHVQPAWRALTGREPGAKNAQGQAQPGCRKKRVVMRSVWQRAEVPACTDPSDDPMGIELVIDGDGYLCALRDSASWSFLRLECEEVEGKLPWKCQVHPVLVNLMAESAHPGKLSQDQYSVGPQTRTILGCYTMKIVQKIVVDWVLSRLS